MKEKIVQKIISDIIETAYWRLPKDYRKSDEYDEQIYSDKFEEAVSKLSLEDFMDILRECIPDDYQE